MNESIRRAARGAMIPFVLLLVAGCIPGFPFGGPAATPIPAPTPTPLWTVDAFRAQVTAIGFQARGPVSGSIEAQTILGTRAGTMSGSFAVNGGDSSYSVTAKLLGVTESADYVVVGARAWSRSNGGQWTQTQATGKTLPVLVAGLILADTGIETHLGRQLHHLTVANPSDVDLSAFGIAPGSRDNLTVSLSFWTENDGTPAGMTIVAGFDQKILGTPSHENATIDLTIEALSGVTITPPTA
jgi:hypothetical protein